MAKDDESRAAAALLEARQKKEEELAATRSPERNWIAFVTVLLAAITLVAKLMGWF